MIEKCVFHVELSYVYVSVNR